MNELQVHNGDLIAVYGLLRVGQSGFNKFGLEQAFSYMGPCKIAGKMLDMDGFPGLFAGEGVVVGDLFRIVDPQIMISLDEFEDFWPQQAEKSRYVRKKTQLIAPEATQAWLYHCLLPATDRPQVLDGDWVKWFLEHYSAAKI